MPSILEGLLGLGGAAAGGGLLYSAYDELGNIGDSALAQTQQLADQAVGQAAFTPFGVTTGTGAGASISPTGQINYQLSPEEQAQQDQLLGSATSLFGQAAAPNQQTEQQVYDRLIALQEGQFARDASSTLANQFNQGNLGVQSGAYAGSNPQQLALAEAQAQARNQAALQAIQQSRADQLQAANIGSVLQGAAYLPQGQLSNLFAQGIQGGQLVNQANQFGAGLFSDLVSSGISAQLGARQGQANLAGQLGASLLGGSLQSATGEHGWLGALGEIFG